MSARYMKPSEVARRFSVSNQTVYRWIAADRLPGAIRVDKSWRIPADAVDRLESQSARPAP